MKHLTRIERRKLCKTILGLVPFASPGVRRALADMVAGDALAATGGGRDADALGSVRDPQTILIEINLRDQWDFGHVMAAPRLAMDARLIRGETGRKAAFFHRPEDLTRLPNDIFLTPDSLALAPHADSLAMIELCEMPVGSIHGHEAANATRSPGRGYVGGAGRLPMWERDAHAKVGGNENHYSAVPTSASLHNQWQRTLTPELINGFALKGIGRLMHTVYHFAHDLPRGELDRFASKQALITSFSTQTPLVATPAEAQLLEQLLRRLDRRYLLARGFGDAAVAQHDAVQADLARRFHPEGGGFPGLALSEAEVAHWSAGVPPQRSEMPHAQIWEQTAFAAKLAASGLARTIALEFDYGDVHDMRSEDQMRTMGLQTSLPLARLIEALKDAGIYHRTLIAVYTLDGSRSPAANSFGSEGKNAVLLAGGMIRGGYFGDIAVDGAEADGHRFRYFPPQADGTPHPGGTIGNDLRVPGAAVWRTVARALAIPDAEVARYAEVRDVAPLAYVLRG